VFFRRRSARRMGFVITFRVRVCHPRRDRRDGSRIDGSGGDCLAMRVFLDSEHAFATGWCFANHSELRDVSSGPYASRERGRERMAMFAAAEARERRGAGDSENFLIRCRRDVCDVVLDDVGERLPGGRRRIDRSLGTLDPRVFAATQHR